MNRYLPACGCSRLAGRNTIVIHQLQEYLRDEPVRFPESFDLIAVLLFSLSGVVAAMRRGYDAVGVFILALVTGAGGGLIRDGLFLQQGPPALTKNWRFLPAVFGACLVGWLVHDWIVRWQKGIAVLDAVGLGIFSMAGLLTAIKTGLSVPASVLVGVVNAVGGGLMRDLLTGEEPLLFKPGQFYVLASLAGCLIFVSLAYEAVLTPRHAEWLSVAAIFGLRIFAIMFNWRTTPLQPPFNMPASPAATASARPPVTARSKEL
jgi:uncharacterized membrane protein YeiH